MIKILAFLSVSTLLIFQGNAQNPDLFGTWYLQGYQLNSGGYFPVPQTSPQIAPYVTFLDIPEPQNGEGDGGCNLFTANFVYDSSESLYQIDVFTAPSNPCTDPIGTDYEAIIFQKFFEEGSMYHYAFYTATDGNTVLVIQNQFLDFAEFKNDPLAVPENALHTISLYPNPTTDKLFLHSGAIPIEKLSVFDLSGQRILESTNTAHFIDVSNLAKGLYLLEITTPEGKTLQKFIKK
ncbi:MAG: T9SS type A sorting domain-containing protein [Altibacter sp.]|uniref:T9SS type A sorting domain-containing protein n=1 Tax=Altibacter sp. TaxID=2024823 RepID=UPI001DDEFB9C|nr:T9SS type A sorting domain-containing protein [Altibacter sp.]MBZ0326204.1 T9SS type A sorting domain-containing protein [Altibacter sp.]